MRHASIALLGCALLFSAAGAEERDVSGRVLDANGAPVAGIEVAPYWYQRDGRLAPRGAVRTDRAGAFSVKVRWQKRARSIMAMDAARARGAAVLLDKESLARPLTLRLAPLVTLRGTVSSTGLGHAPEQVFLSATAQGALIAAAAATGGPAFALPLPPGRYRLTMRPRHCKRWSKTVELDAGAGELDLGTIDAEPTVIARHYGKPLPPWTLTEARGVGKDVQLADFKGKWVLLEFWGFW